MSDAGLLGSNLSRRTQLRSRLQFNAEDFLLVGPSLAGMTLGGVTAPPLVLQSNPADPLRSIRGPPTP